MSKYDSMVVRQRKWMLYLLAILVIGAGLTPYKDIFLGLLLGSTVSFYNLFILQRRIDDLGEKVNEGKRPKGLGTISRFAAVGLGVIIALRFEAHFNIIALVIGYMTSYVIITLDFIVVNRKR